MVDLLATYVDILQRGIVLYDTLISLYQPDIKTSNDWADITVAETITKRDGLAQRLANPKLTVSYTSTLVGSIDHYIDSHWADYQEFPTSNPIKHEQVLHLHDALKALMGEITPLHNGLMQSV